MSKKQFITPNLIISESLFQTFVFLLKYLKCIEIIRKLNNEFQTRKVPLTKEENIEFQLYFYVRDGNLRFNKVSGSLIVIIIETTHSLLKLLTVVCLNNYT